MRPDRTYLWLGLIAGLAFLIRIGVVLYLGEFKPPWDQEWEIIARTLVDQGYFGLDVNSVYGPNPRSVTSFIPPLYPAFLALMAKLFGAWSWLATRLVQTVVSTVSVILVYWLGQAIFRRHDVAVVGALLAAGFPLLVGGVAEINPVSFEVLFLQVFVLLTLRAMLQPSRQRWALAGSALGLAALTRAPALFLLPWLPIVLWVNKPRAAPVMTSVVQPILITAVAAAVVISPWTLRNYWVHRELILISSNGGINFWIGNNEQATGEFIWPPGVAPDLLKASENLGEGARDRFFYEQGLWFIRHNPQRFLRLLGVKLIYFLWARPAMGETYANQTAIGLGRMAYLVGTGLLLPLWLLGLLLTAKDWRRLTFLYGPIVGTLLVNLAYFVGTRFRTPAAPYQILLASYALVMGAHYLRQQFCFDWRSPPA